MKVTPAPKLRCEYCQIIRRRRGNGGKGGPVIFVICKRKARHKQRQG